MGKEDYECEPNVTSMSLTGVCTSKMLEWHEREYEDDDDLTLQDYDTMVALKCCGLLKYFMTQCMRKQVALLEFIVSMWGVNDQSFHVGPHILKIELKAI